MIRAGVACVVALLSALGCATTPPRRSDPPAPISFVVERRAWTYDGVPGRLIATPSVNLATTADDPRLLVRLPDFLELAARHRLDAIVPLRPPVQSLDTFVLGTRPEWERMTRRLLAEHARPYLRIERGGYAAQGRGVFYDIGPRDTFVMAAHEGWHQLVQTSFDDPLPLWIDEGIACTLEGFRWREDQPDRPEFLAWCNPERFDQLRAASARGSLLPLDRLLDARPQDLIDADKGGGPALDYYAQCWALALFLIESDAGARRPGLERLLLDAQDGRLLDRVETLASPDESASMRRRRTGAGALRVYWPGESTADMDRAYQAFITRCIATGGRDRMLQGRSPADR